MVELLRLIYLKKDQMIQSDLIRYKHYLHFITNAKNVCCTMNLAKELCQIKAINKFGKEYLKFEILNYCHEEWKVFQTDLDLRLLDRKHVLMFLSIFRVFPGCRSYPALSEKKG